MLFNKGKNVKLNLTQNALKYFSHVDMTLQAASFVDGHFAGAFGYFRHYYFDLIDKEMKNMTNEEKLEFAEINKRNELQTLAALSRVLKDEVFDDYLNKMYSQDEQEKIRQGIRQIPTRIPVAPINKHTEKNK